MSRLTQLVRKVPEVTIFFWIIKLLSTALGEATSDYLVHTIDPVIAVGIGGVCFAGALLLQLLVHRYVPWIYWLTVVMVAIFGTMAADVVHIVLGVPYLISTIFFAIALAVIFFLWYRIEKTLSIHSINNLRRELFYWTTVVITFALGTAAGDMSAITLGLGYLSSGILFALLFALPGVGYRKFGLNEIAAFWFGYILTRPLGASFADYFGRTRDLGGIGFGTARTSVVLAVLIICLVTYLSVTKRDINLKQ
jgi:uncharacterized membrane-anchored protein